MDYYNNNGNITELENLEEIHWNYRDNISSAVLLKRDSGQNDAEYYVYDSTGQRVRKVKETMRTTTVTEIEEKIYLGGVEIKRIRSISGATTTQELNRSSLHVVDDTRRIAVVHNWSVDTNNRETDSSADFDQNKTRYQYGNHLDSASLELDSTGNIISYEEYFPYGGSSFIAGTNQKEVKLKEYRYTGKEKDDATGLYYYGARYYASWVGRWLSLDSLFRNNPAVKSNDIEGKYLAYGESGGDKQKLVDNIPHKFSSGNKNFGNGREFLVVRNSSSIPKNYQSKSLNLPGIKSLYNSINLNLFCYCYNNPIKYFDPDGMQVWEEVGGAGIGLYVLTLVAALLLTILAMKALETSQALSRIQSMAREREREEGEQTEKHHPYPMFLGGPRVQTLVPMERSRHRQLHRDLGAFLDTFYPGMRPVRGRQGSVIREQLYPNINTRLNAMARFYLMNIDEYPDAAASYFSQYSETLSQENYEWVMENAFTGRLRQKIFSIFSPRTTPE